MPESPLPPPSNDAPRRVREIPSPPIVAAPPPLPSTTTHAPAATAPPAIKDAENGRSASWWDDRGRTDVSAWLTSFVVHAVALFLLGLITLNSRTGGSSVRLMASLDTAAPAGAPGISSAEPLLIEPSKEQGEKDESPIAPSLGKPVEAEAAIALPKPVKIGGEPRPTKKTKPDNPQASPKAQAGLAPTGGGWEGRGSDRAGLAGGGGGTPESEAAVERGLRWLAAHQNSDGSWRFDLKGSGCDGQCSHPGDESSTVAATGLALLPFLGAGYTHLEGEHKEVVKRGLYYLSTQAMVMPANGGVNFCGTSASGMYGQGIVTIALCESYGMTHDESLKEIAQGAVQYIVKAQDTKGGGWRYKPRSPGDTTVSGWQLMALKSAQMARLDVPSPTLGLVNHFLDTVQFEHGARYGYLTPTVREEKQEATTAVGLLCRMYLGWHRDNPALYQGVSFLHRWGPSDKNLYYDYYATQVMRHWGGPEWREWNKKMRNHLVSHQSNTGHEAGSWYFSDPYGDRAGRLYNTALALMILEVYYRHMPLYGQKAIEKGI